MNCRKPGVAILIAAALLAATAYADDSGPFDYSFNAFGTAGVVHSSDDQADFVSNGRQPAGAGFTHRWSVTPDSKLGAQATASFRDQLSAVVQLVSQYQADGTYKPEVAWANLKYQVTPDADVRVGRIALPTFMYSDTLNVGYALPYVRIPMEIYTQLPVANSDGIDGSYRFRFGDVTNTLQAFVGRFNLATPGGGHYDVRDLRGVADTLEDGALTVHLSYQALRYDLTVAGLTFTGDHQSIVSIGVSYDPGTWFVSGEWLRAPDEQDGLYYGAYLMGGYHFDKLTAYIGYARAYEAAAGSLGLQSFIDQYTNTLGLRWDVVRHVDLKLQLDRTVLQGSMNGFFINQQPGFDPTGTVNILSLAVDFVW